MVALLGGCAIDVLPGLVLAVSRLNSASRIASRAEGVYGHLGGDAFHPTVEAAVVAHEAGQQDP